MIACKMSRLSVAEASRILCEYKTLKLNRNSLKSTANEIIGLLLLSFAKLFQTMTLFCCPGVFCD